MWSNVELKRRASEIRTKYYGTALGATLVMSMVAGIGSASTSSANSVSNFINLLIGTDNVAVISFLSIIVIVTILGIVINALVSYPVNVGGTRVLTRLCLNENQIGDLGFAFRKGNYKNVVKTMFLKDLYIFLWTLLFYIPGIIKSYEYRMIPYILAENPTLDTEKCFELSREMMKGEKMNAFCLDLSFIGWYILSIFTCGILLPFYVVPYQSLTNAELYLVLRGKVMNTDTAGSTGYSNPYNDGFNNGYNNTYNNNTYSNNTYNNNTYSNNTYSNNTYNNNGYNNNNYNNDPYNNNPYGSNDYNNTYGNNNNNNNPYNSSFNNNYGHSNQANVNTDNLYGNYNNGDANNGMNNNINNNMSNTNTSFSFGNVDNDGQNDNGDNNNGQFPFN